MKSRLRTATCLRCKFRFQYRNKQKAIRSYCRECAIKVAAENSVKQTQVAPDAFPGECIEDYLERKDRRAWNID
jgi:hypothetical protein